MPTRARWLAFIPALIVAGLSTAVHASAYRTVEIVAVVHCEEHPTKVCGFDSVDELRDMMRARLTWTNELFRPNGMSFRLDEVHVVEDNALFSWPGCRDHNVQFRDDLAAEWAADDPDRLYWFAFQEATGGCCAVFPWAGSAPSTNAVYCSMDPGRPNLAHEYGHSFCLLHTFREVSLPGGGTTKWDPVNGPGDHNGDGVADTAPDPGSQEVGTDPLHHDSDGTQTFPGHDWCVRQQDTNVDQGSVGSGWCTLDCTRVDAQGGASTLDVGNASWNIMSYWDGCRGPYTESGMRHEGTSPTQRQLVDDCIVGYPAQRTYANACPEGDWDHDGWCNLEDECVGVYNATLADLDGDGVGDACDNCVDVPNAGQENLDGDPLGDACDPDDDGDQCCDPWDPYCAPWLADQHPTESHVPVGMIHYVGCPGGNVDKVKTAYEGVDTDGDGFLDCQDDDDDNDGFLDDDDPCPLHAGTDQIPGNDSRLCLEARPCSQPWPEQCRPFCGPGLFARLWSVINPDPTRVMVWDRLAVFDDAMHLGTTAGIPFSEQLGAFLGGNIQFGRQPTADGTTGTTPEILELQLWAGDPFGGPAEFVEVLARFEALDPESLGDPRFGRTLVFERGPDGGVAVRPTWTLGMSPDAELPDADLDGVPDVADACLNVPDPYQADGDRDGYGDACDADFDQDGLVSPDEVREVEDCVGVDLTWVYTPDAAEHPEEYPPRDPAIAAAVVRCENRDLDGDRDVDADDLGLATALLAGPPGPSGLLDLEVGDDGDDDEDADEGDDESDDESDDELGDGDAVAVRPEIQIGGGPEAVHLAEPGPAEGATIPSASKKDSASGKTGRTARRD